MGGPLQGDTCWRWAAASRIGTSHQRMGTRKQDAYGVRLSSKSLLAVVSDGAGSASYGGEGASLVCRHLLTKATSWFAANDSTPDDEAIHSWMDDLRDRLALAATRREISRRQFAATVALLMVAPHEVLTLQIGDSVVVARREGEWEALCWPENGEFAATTFFVTDEPEPRLRIARNASNFDGFALFSDGIEAVSVNHATRKPHGPFFDPMIGPIDLATGRSGRLSVLSSNLASFLDSPRLCDRTDDDKTLILISGR